MRTGRKLRACGNGHDYYNHFRCYCHDCADFFNDNDYSFNNNFTSNFASSDRDLCDDFGNDNDNCKADNFS